MAAQVSVLLPEVAQEAQGTASNSPAEDPQPTYMPLDFDTLCEIMSCIDDRQTLLNVMLTCRTLHRRGVPLLLAPGVIMDDAYLDSFCSFMLSDTSRLPLLRAVGFSLFFRGPPPPHIADAFVSVLRNAVGLQWLSVHSSVLKLLGDDRIWQAIASLQGIEDLTVDGFSDEALRLLPVMQSPVRFVKISFHGRHLRSSAEPQDFVLLLAHLRHSLESITAKSVTWSPLDAQVCYPHVTSLSLADCSEVDVVSLVRAFPHLRDLHFRIEYDWADEWNIAPDVARERNLARQRLACWPSLRLLESPLLRFWAMAPICHIEQLVLELCDPDHRHWQWYSDALALVQPKYLALTFILGAMQNTQTLFERTPPCVDRLMLKLHYRAEYNPFTDALDNLLSAIRSRTSLTHLKLRLFWEDPRSVKYGREVTADPQKPFHTHSWLPYTGDTSLAGLAERIAAALSALVFLSIDLHMSFGTVVMRTQTGCWQVDRHFVGGDGRATVVLLETDVDGELGLMDL